LSDFGVIVHDETDDVKRFSTLFKKWQKQRDIATIVIEVETKDKTGVILRLKELGYKVVS
jgi:glyceraldehyde-3-phosphate dehydrogenase/erythrose-4-phosphate dehydrogenase